VCSIKARRRQAKPRFLIAAVWCGLPVKRPPSGCLLHERRNGQFVLQVTGHPSYGLHWGQDRLVPIFLATLAIRQRTPRITFESAAKMLDTFAMQQGGSQYRRLVGAFSAHLRCNHLLWHRHATGTCRGGASRPVQFHERSSHLVFPRP
jgi:hypothetical protein